MVGMIGLTRWLTGWVEFSIQGKKKGQAERFLTLSARSGFCFWGMEPEGEGFRCRVRAVEYPELRSGARRCRVRLRVLRRRGLPFWQQKLCRRKGLALGGAVFCLLLWFLSGRFWIITVSGNEELPQSLLLSAAQEEGLFSGVARDSIDEKVLAAALMERFPEIGWVSVNTRNCQAEICLEEGIPKPEDQSGETPANILAAADGQILSIDAFDGVAMVKAGDTVTLSEGEEEPVSVKITHVVENYFYHYVYMTPDVYRQLYGKDPEYTEIFTVNRADDEDFEQQFQSRYMELPGVLNVTFISSMAERVADMLRSMDTIIYVVIIAAGLLAFVVLYNLNNINISERRRELATLKVLGFYDIEVSQYVFRENVILTVIGAAAGVLIGLVLHRFVILTAEVDMMMFGRNIKPVSFLYSILLTFLFSMLVNVFMHFQLKKLNMVESMKSVE